ncbi:MAG: hypothetical protein LBR85_05450, partial [Oscillospiraceae bacterium]|nr:hypothetical protein [Oscillospiraceae bacterium]
MTSRQKKAALSVTVPALCAALLFAQQIALQALPNIELVSLLVIVFTLAFKLRVLYIIYVFALLEGLYFGFNLWWWIPYLYVWTLLALISHLMRAMKSPVGWAALSGTFGLAFGALCALPHLVTGGPAFALSYWVSGIPFDLVHCVSNFMVCLLLFKPLTRFMEFAVRRTYG